MSFSDDNNHYFDGNFKIILQKELEKIISLNEAMTHEVNDFIQKITKDTESVISGKVTSKEDIRSLHKRLQLAMTFVKDKHIQAHDLQDKDLFCRMEILEKHIEMFLNCTAEHKNLEQKLTNCVEEWSKLHGELKRKVSLKCNAVEGTAQQRSSETHSEILKQKLKLIDMEEKIMKQLDIVSEELLRVKINISKIEENVKSNSYCTHDIMEQKNQASYASNTEIDKCPQIIKSGLESDILQLKEDIKVIKHEMSKLSVTSFNNISGVPLDDQLQIQKETFDKMKEDIFQLKETCLNQVQQIQQDLNVLKKNKQKFASQLLKLAKQTEQRKSFEEDVKLKISVLEQHLQDLNATNEIEDFKTVFEGLCEKVDNNSYDIHQCWEMLDKRETVEDNLLQEIEALKYVQINEEKYTTESMIGQLSIGLEVITAQLEDVNDRTTELYRNFTRMENAYSVLTAEQKPVSKTDLTAAVMELGIKYELMKELITKRVDRLEILRRNLTVLNKAVTTRKDVENQVTAIKTSLDCLQPVNFKSNKSAQNCCQELKEPVTAYAWNKDQETLLPDNIKQAIASLDLKKTNESSPQKPDEINSDSLEIPSAVCAASNFFPKHTFNSLCKKANNRFTNSSFSFENSLSSQVPVDAPPVIRFSFGRFSEIANKHTKWSRSILSRKKLRQFKSSSSVTEKCQGYVFTRSLNFGSTCSTHFTNPFKSSINPLPTDTRMFHNSAFLTSLPDTVMGTNQPSTAASGVDSYMKNGMETKIPVKYQCITFMREYDTESLEELRWTDYQVKKYVSATKRSMEQIQPQR